MKKVGALLLGAGPLPKRTRCPQSGFLADLMLGPPTETHRLCQQP
jgi:hypothetical protein